MQAESFAAQRAAMRGALARSGAEQGPSPLPFAVPSSLADLAHASLLSVELDESLTQQAGASCEHCRFACDSAFAACDRAGSAAHACSAGQYLAAWAADSHMKPIRFDFAHRATLASGAEVAVASVGGRANEKWKPGNQDAFIVQQLPGRVDGDDDDAAAAPAVVGVFDGHGRLGRLASHYVRDALSLALERQPPVAASEDASAGGSSAATAAGRSPGEALEAAFHKAAAALVASGKDFSKSGSTAVVCMLHGDSVTVAWAGDSRAVLGVWCEDGVAYGGAPSLLALPLTSDHKPDQPQELQRIAAAGGRIDRLHPHGPFRVFLPGAWAPGLAVSRAFGDGIAATVGVTHLPDIATYPLPQAPCAVSYDSSSSSSSSAGSSATGSPPHSVLIVASDGLWEWVTNEEAVAAAAAQPSAEDAAAALVELAQKHWASRYRGAACDDITAAVVFLPCTPQRG